MEISSTVFSDILSPLAIFSPSPPLLSASSPHETNVQERQAGVTPVESSCPWKSSPLNPKNRIDSLEPLLLHNKTTTTTWRLDGADTDGRRFFVTPHFALDSPPARIDVYLPPFEEYPPALRCVLRPESVLWTPRHRVADSLMGRYVLRALHHWSSGIPDFRDRYGSMPFGSQILVTKVSPCLDDVEIHLYPRYEVEQAMVSVEMLKKMWGGDLGGDADADAEDDEKKGWRLLPEVIELDELRFRRQLHEAITLVDVAPGRRRQRDEKTSGLLVFKSLLRDQRHMYNELKMLLSLGRHKNLVPRPKYVVVKRGRFGGRKGVCGFVMEYFPLGSLKERLLLQRDKMDLEEKFRFAKQITEVLIHVNAHEKNSGFYPDLKPDNIVLKESEEEPGKVDAVLLDLEQRGGWFSWSPPEVGYVEYLEIIATHAPDWEEEKKEKALNLLQAYIPGWKAMGQNARYFNSEGGFSAPWLALLKERQEKGSPALERAQVFMLGKLLWCIFEGEARVRCGIDHEVLQENDVCSPKRFPDFENSPIEIKELIKTCTAGAPEWSNDEASGISRDGIVLQGGKLYPASAEVGLATVEDTANVATNFWLKETHRAETFIEKLVGSQVWEDGETPWKPRPLLAEVLVELERIEKNC